MRGPVSAVPWLPPCNASGRLFQDFVTISHGERGAYESPQEQADRIAGDVILHCADRAGGLPALAAGLQNDPDAHLGASFSRFVEQLVIDAARDNCLSEELPKVLEELGEDLDKGQLAMVSARLQELGVLREGRARGTPLLEQIR
jgi:hypothetical protein